MVRHGCVVLLMSLASVARGQAEPTLSDLVPLLRPHLIAAVEGKTYEHSRSWGRTALAPHALRWHGLRPEIQKTPQNDGHWQKIKVSPRDLKNNFDLRISNPHSLGEDRQGFQVFVSFLANVEYEHQLWESGLRLYSGGTRARLRADLTLDVENTMRMEPSKSGSFVPDIVVRVKVTKAKLKTRDLVVEHTAGVGGTAAKLIGESVEGLIHEFNPGLEKRLHDRATAAILKAADTREVRIGLGSLMGKK